MQTLTMLTNVILELDRYAVSSIKLKKVVLKKKVYSVFESLCYFSLNDNLYVGNKSQSDNHNDNYDGSKNDEAVERYDCGHNL